MVKFEDLKSIGQNWANEYCKALNDDPEYAEVAKGWGVDFEGAMVFVMEACGEIEDNISAFIDLKDGKCLGIKVLAPGENPPRPPSLTLYGSFLLWKKLAFKELNPVQLMMKGKLRVEGDMDLVMRYAKAAIKLADVVEKTDTSFFNLYDLGPDEE